MVMRCTHILHLCESYYNFMLRSIMNVSMKYQNMEKKDEEHEEQGMNEALTEARPSESAELKNRVHG